MNKQEREIKERVKKGVKSFDAWYHKNEVRIIRVNTTTQYKKEQQEFNKYRIKQGKKIACINFVLFVAILLVAFCLPSKINDKFYFEDTRLIIPEEIAGSVNYDTYFYDCLVKEYNNMMVDYMGFSLSFSDAKSFATKIDDDSLVLLGAIVEKKIDGQKSFLSYRFSANAQKEFDDYDDYKNLKDYKVVGNYKLFYDEGTKRDDYYFYKVKVEKIGDHAIKIRRISDESIGNRRASRRY